MQDHNPTPFDATDYAQELSHSSSLLSIDGLSPVSGNLVSSPVTSINNPLPSPAQTSCTSSNAPGFLSGTSEREKFMVGFYERQCQHLKDDLARSKEQYASLWNMYEKLSKHSEAIQAMLFDRLKRPLPRDLYKDSESSISTPLTTTHADATSPAGPAPLSRSDYPHIKFWLKREWVEYKSSQDDSSQFGNARGSRGGTRSAKGENVMMLYIEHEDGTPVDGTMASNIRELARALWRGLHQSGHAPDKWGNATNEVRNKFFREMELSWPVLRFCDNHWKTNQIATSLYSQWYGTYHKRSQTLQISEDGVQQPKKRAKTSGAMEPIDRTLDVGESPPPDEQDNTESPPTNSNPIGGKEVIFSQRPGHMPLRDPLAGVFDAPSCNFPVLDMASPADVTTTMRHDIETTTNAGPSVSCINIAPPVNVLLSPNMTSAANVPFLSPMVIALMVSVALLANAFPPANTFPPANIFPPANATPPADAAASANATPPANTAASASAFPRANATPLANAAPFKVAKGKVAKGKANQNKTTELKRKRYQKNEEDGARKGPDSEECMRYRRVRIAP